MITVRSVTTVAAGLWAAGGACVEGALMGGGDIDSAHALEPFVVVGEPRRLQVNPNYPIAILAFREVD